MMGKGRITEKGKEVQLSAAFTKEKDQDIGRRKAFEAQNTESTE